MARALGVDLRERGFGEFLTPFRDEARQELEAQVGIKASCELTGISRATLYRARRPRPATASTRPAPPNKLSAQECHELIEVLNSREFIDKAPRQVWATLLDRGRYLASPSTMARLLKAEGQSGERRAQARHEARKKPHLLASAPNRIWTWDITKLRGPAPGQFFDLYVMIDIFSRCVVHWEVHAR
jgi:putative transposase